jgi:hypothetical protein
LLSHFEDATRDRLGAAAVGGLAAAIVLVSGLAGATASLSLSQRLSTLLLCTTPLAISVLLFNDRHLQKIVVSRLKRQIETLVDVANRELLGIRETDGITIAVAALCKLLDTPPPKEYRSAIARFICKNSTTIVLDPASATSFIQMIAELARQDLANLTDMLSVHEQLRAQSLLTTVAVEDSRNPFFQLQLEGLTSQAAAFVNLISQRRWNDFRQSCTSTIEQLKTLQEQARRRKEPAVVLPAGSDPYQVLGIERGMPSSELRKLRTRLALIYHPDATEGFANSSKMAEINAAFDAVVSQRKQT